MKIIGKIVLYPVWDTNLMCILDFDSLYTLLEHNEFFNIHLNSSGYPRIYSRLEEKCIEIHKLLKPNIKYLDHKNQNKLDARLFNLRKATDTLNNANKKKIRIKKPSSIFKGVSKKGLNSYQASIAFKNKKYYLGSFSLETEAALAYDKKAVELFGEHACLNFPIKMEPIQI